MSLFEVVGIVNIFLFLIFCWIDFADFLGYSQDIGIQTFSHMFFSVI